MKVEIPKGCFYSCRDTEELSCTEAGEAVEEYLDSWADPGDTFTKLAEEHCPLELTAYNPREVDTESLATKMVEDVVEVEYADPDGGHGLTTAQSDELRQELMVVLDAFIKKHDLKPWECERVGTVELDKDDVLELLGEKT